MPNRGVSQNIPIATAIGFRILSVTLGKLFIMQLKRAGERFGSIHDQWTSLESDVIAQI